MSIGLLGERKTGTFYISGSLQPWMRALGQRSGVRHEQWLKIQVVHALGIPSFDLAQWAVARAGWVAPFTIDVLPVRVDPRLVYSMHP